MPLPLKSGDLLRNRYTIKRIIGQGGMGSIYLAEDTRLSGRLCALKEVEHDKTLDKQLNKEARNNSNGKRLYWRVWTIPTFQSFRFLLDRRP
jgi:serine/threonine protein kinase